MVKNSIYLSRNQAGFLFILFFATAFFQPSDSKAQVNCSSNVPTFTIDFTGNPAGTYTTPSIVRAGNCCGTSSPDRCIHFELTLDSQTVAISFDITSGAIPPGALFYQVDCGPPTPVGEKQCITGSGVHDLTFCKPGNNTNTYTITAIPAPIFPPTDTVRVGCTTTMSVLGLVENTITWNSIFPGAPGAYNSYLSCTANCDSTQISPVTGSPAFVDYEICGFPIASDCGFNFTVCDTVRLIFYPELEASVSPNPASFCTTSTGVMLTSTVTGGYGAYSYTWKNGLGAVIATSPNYFATAPDNYTLEVTDELDCPTEIVPVPVNMVNVTLSTTKVDVACNGDSTGSATVNPVGGNLPYSYSWNSTPIQTTQTAVNLPIGTYTVTVTDFGGCSNNIAVTINQPPAIVASVDSFFNVTCNGNSNGRIYISASGGAGTLSYSWSPGGYTTQDITGIGPGTYTVTISDTNGCTEIINQVITQPGAIDPLPVAAVSSTDLLCYQDSSGTAAVNTVLVGGTPPYTYIWGNGETTSSIDSLPAGPIYLQITDANGCTTDTTVTINEPTPLVSSFPGTSSYFCGYAVSCNGASDGSIDFSLSGGTPNYSFSWNGGAYTTEDLSGIPAGFYQVQVTDANGCTLTDTITISEPDPIIVNISSPVNAGGFNIACKGENSGVIHTGVIGGCPQYTYDWGAGPVPEDSLTDLFAGFYSVTVTDQNGCSMIDTITLTEPDTIVPLITSVSINGVGVSCNGGSDGTVYLESITGGSPPYTYSWNTGSTNDTIFGVNSGQYSILVVDVNGCSNDASIFITQPDPLNAQLSTSLYNAYEISCNGASDGFIQVDTTFGGVQPYSFQWSTGGTNDSISNVPAGSYTLVISDANLCTDSILIVLTEPTALLLNADTSNIDCNGNATGYIDLFMSGGTGNYFYLWNTTETTSSISGLTIGNYCVDITDDNNCLLDTCFDLTEPTLLVLDSIYATVYPGGWNVSCNGGDNGNMFSDVSGGSPPYAFYWSNGDSTQNSLNVSVFTYYLTVTDDHGCTVNDSLTLTEPPLVESTIDVLVDVACFGDASGSITISSVGGTPTYQYSLDSITFSPTTTIGNLTTGAYMLYTLDTNGCSDTTSFFVDQPAAALSAQITTQTNVDCFGNATGDVTVTGLDGTAPYQYSIDSISWQSSGTFSGLIAGTYMITVVDTNGCVTQQPVTISEPAAALSASIATQVNVDCFGNATGTVDVTAADGTAPYQFSIDGTTFQSTGTFSGLIAGSYTVTVVDTNGCITTVPVNISQPAAALSSQITSQVNVDCFNTPTGEVTVDGIDGTPPYQYSIDGVTFQASGTFTGLTVGAYTVTVMDSNGCLTTQPVNITQPPGTVVVNLASQTNVDCFGNATGVIVATGSLGTPPYTYSLDSITFTPDSVFLNLTAGSYTVYIQDTNGCVSSMTVNIGGPAAALSASITTQVNVDCFGNATGSVDVLGANGTAPYEYSIDGGATWQSSGTFSGLTAGSYTITVRDTNGCLTTQAVNITEPSAALSASITTQVNVDCFGNATGSVDVLGANGTAPYEYSIDTGATWQSSGTFGGLTAGTYLITVRDTNGCTTTQTVNIGGPAAALSASITTQVNVDCFGNTTGSVTVTASNGTPGYQYSIDGVSFQSSGTFSNLGAGAFTITVVDTNGCTTTVPVNISGPSAALSASISSQVNVDCFGNATGSVDVAGSNGTPPYQYSIDGGTTWQSSGSFAGLTAGAYTVTVRDTNGCLTTQSINISGPAAALTASITTQVDVDCFGNTNGSVEVTASNGTQPYQYSIDGGTTWQSSGIFSNLGSGAYTVTVRDTNGCLTTQTVNIGGPTAALTVNITSQVNADCFGNATGEITATGVDGTVPYQYSIDGTTFQTGGTFSNLTAGSYTITVRDDNGCLATQTVNITEPGQLTTTATGPAAVCGSSALVNGQMTGATGMWTSIDPGITFNDPTNPNTTVNNMVYGVQNALIWTVTLTPCTASDTVYIQADEPVTADVDSNDQELCIQDPQYDGHFHIAAVPPVPGSGLWSVISGTGTINDPTQLNIEYSTNVAGTSVLLWTVTNGMCSANDTTTVILKDDGVCLELELPTGFSPNSDGHNDDYDIHGIERYPENTFVVFNRWGNEVYKKDNYINHDWKGQNSDGEPLPSGTYYVILVLRDGKKFNTYVDMRR